MTEIAHNVDYSGFFDNVTDFTTANIIKMFGWLGDGCIDEGDHDGLMYTEVYNSETSQYDYYIKAGKAMLNGIYVNQDSDILICSGKNYTYNKVVIARANFSTGKVQIIEQIDTVDDLSEVSAEYNRYIGSESYGMTRDSNYYDIPLCFWSDSYKEDLRRLLNVGYRRNLSAEDNIKLYPSDNVLNQTVLAFESITPQFFRKGSQTASIIFKTNSSSSTRLSLMEADRNKYFTDGTWTKYAGGNSIYKDFPSGSNLIITFTPCFSSSGYTYIFVDTKEYPQHF